MKVNGIEMNSTVEIPASIGKALGDNPHKGVCAIYKDNETNEWSMKGLEGSPFNKRLITKIIQDGKWNEYAADFVIVNPEGMCCYKTKDDIQVQTDANGYVHIGDDEYLVKIINDPRIRDTMCFIGGKNLEDINSRVARRVESGMMSQPKGFGSNGFEDGPISPEPQPGDE